MRPSFRFMICFAAATAAVAAGQTGTPGIAAFDRMMSDFMPKYNIPGGSLNRGQGRASGDGARLRSRRQREQPLPVQPDSLFRIASLSKILTSVAIMRLSEQGKLSVDQPALQFPARSGRTSGHHRGPTVETDHHSPLAYAFGRLGFLSQRIRSDVCFPGHRVGARRVSAGLH